ncbi:NitT/TauT family transport system ATP-binding protein [Leucobacter luti]|uniref:NitT/TauT family transport system ATP-binding protein n=1 Tax=Leucobacter luti TaxID=340320 RepID=A0A4R6RS96_9MICO|nr:ABC transporter ATP-binding protein [Leucobacter luti]TDP89739.1 NitT/TauT family transport system ATP-binding protein [Leucobacter luti]
MAATAEPRSLAGERLSYRVRGVNQTFLEGQVVALQDINHDFDEGSFTSLIGPSGCGKSTLLNILAGLLKPSSGSVMLGGKEVDKPRDEAGIMFQKATLLPWRNVLDNLLLPIELSEGKKAAKRRAPQALELLDTVGLKGFDKAYPDELSGGMAQRAAICRMLITEPEVLLLDEPFGALDELTRERMDLEIQRIAMNRNATVVLVTHSIPESVLLSDRVIAMSARPGRITEVIDIDLPRPRTLDTMALPEFQKYVSRVREALDRGHANV